MQALFGAILFLAGGRPTTWLHYVGRAARDLRDRARARATGVFKVRPWAPFAMASFISFGALVERRGPRAQLSRTSIRAAPSAVEAFELGEHLLGVFAEPGRAPDGRRAWSRPRGSDPPRAGACLGRGRRPLGSLRGLGRLEASSRRGPARRGPRPQSARQAIIGAPRRERRREQQDEHVAVADLSLVRCEPVVVGEAPADRRQRMCARRAGRCRPPG